MNQTAVHAKTEMMIRRPVAEVFEAFINPEITTKFWFTKSSGRLEQGIQLQWDWDMYGASTPVDVKVIEENNRIVIEWPSDSGANTTVEWRFVARSDQETMVTITNTGFSGSDDEIVAAALDATEGFTVVLCGLKALLEHNINLNLIADKAPDHHVTS